MIDTHSPTYGDDLQPMWDRATDAWIAMGSKNGGDVCMEFARQVQCKTLVCHGAKDPICLSDHPEWFAENIAGAELRVFEDGKHNIHLEYADEFNALALHLFASADAGT